MYPKGGEMLHTIRQIVNDDEKWRGILRGLNQAFWHQTVTGSQVQDYISKGAGTDLSRVFEQYLTTIKIPVLEYAVDGATVRFRWANVVPGFNMPVKVRLAGDGYDWVRPTEQWQTREVCAAGRRGLQGGRELLRRGQERRRVGSARRLIPRRGARQ